MNSAINAFSALLALSDKLETSVRRLHERTDLIHDNVDQLGVVQRRFNAALELIPSVEPFAAHDIIITTRLQDFQQTLQTDFEDLNLWEKQIGNARITDRVRRMKQVLDRCEKDVNEFFEFITSQAPILQLSNSGQDRYVRRSNVPVNPPRLTLDYEDPTTCEGKLRDTILHEKEKRVVAFVASGKGGVGKTCALRGLADDKEIKRNFPGGTLYIQLGNDAKLSDIVQGVAKIVERTGGVRLAEKIRTVKTLQEASEKASDWFFAQKCLFLVDDIWRVNCIDSNVLDILGSMVNESSRLVYTTRDRHFLGRAHKHIEFEEKDTDGELARRMLMTHAGFAHEEAFNDKNMIAFKAIIHECQGLPLAFGIAGGAVLEQSRLKRLGREQDAWSDVHQDLISDANRSKFLESSAEQYGGLTKIVDTSLQVLNVRYEQEDYQELFRALCILRKQQSAPLGMLQKLWGLETLEDTKRVANDFSNVSVVQLRDDDDGVSYLQLHDLILDIAKDKASKRFETQRFFETMICNYIRFSRKESEFKREGVIQDETGKVLSEITAPERCHYVQRDIPRERFSYAWWNIVDDGYLHNNLCRALRCSGHTNELVWLLSNPQWIVGRWLKGGILKVELDLEEGKSVLVNKPSSADLKEHLEMVGKAARLSCTYVEDNQREVWFQLYGRLLWHATKNEITREFIDKLERCAPRPWVKASIGVLEQATHSIQDMARCNGKVLCTYEEHEDLWFVWEDDEKQMGVSKYNMMTGSYKSLYLTQTSASRYISLLQAQCIMFLRDQNSIVSVHKYGYVIVWNRETGREKHILECNLEGISRSRRNDAQWRRKLTRCFRSSRNKEATERFSFIACTSDGTRVVSTSESHSIQLWETLSGNTEGQPLRGHTEKVMCVGMSADGNRMVSGSCDKTVRIWDVKSGTVVGQPLLGHNEAVLCVATNADGSVAVSGSADKTVRLWDVKSGKAVGQPLSGHTDKVVCVGMSADGCCIVSGSVDSTVRVWDVKRGQESGKCLRGHTGRVSYVSVNEDGSRIVSGSYDNTVRIWNGQSDHVLGQPHRLHTEAVWVTSCADDSRIVSGHLDEKVKVWDAESGEAVGQLSLRLSERIRCVVISADGKRIVSGSLEETIRIWDAQKCVPVGKPLRQNGAVERVGVDAHGLRVVSYNESGLGSLWDARRGECVLTSKDASWDSTVDYLAFSWSTKTDWRPLGRKIIAPDEDGSAVLLATCEVHVEKVHLNDDVCWTQCFDPCRIMR